MDGLCQWSWNQVGPFKGWDDLQCAWERNEYHIKKYRALESV